MTNFKLDDVVLSTEHPRSIGKIIRVHSDGCLSIEWTTPRSETLPYGHIITELWGTEDFHLLRLDILEDAIEQAMVKFWSSIAESYPNAASGDIEPMLSNHLKTAAKLAVKSWVDWNVPVNPASSGTSEFPNWEAIAEALRYIGFDASVWDSGGNVECVLVEHKEKSWIFGTANDTWGASLEDGDSNAYVETNLGTDKKDPEIVAKAIATALELL